MKDPWRCTQASEAIIQELAPTSVPPDLALRSFEYEEIAQLIIQRPSILPILLRREKIHFLYSAHQFRSLIARGESTISTDRPIYNSEVLFAPVIVANRHNNLSALHLLNFDSQRAQNAS